MPNLTDGEVHLWTLDSAEASLLEEATASAFIEALSEAELRRYHRLQIARRREQYLLGKVFVRKVLSQYRDIDPLSWRFTETEHGKPVLNHESTALAFNLSHSRGMFTLAVGTAGDIGVDVEFASRPRRVMALANRHFSPLEIAALAKLSGPAQQAYFYQLWTLNEAFVKGRGLGLTMPLQDFTIEISETGKIGLSERQAVASRQWHFWSLRLASSRAESLYTAALAVGGKERPPMLRLFEFSLLDEPAELEVDLLASSD